MTEFWVSNERHHCKLCNCWLDAKPSSIRFHEQGIRHQTNLELQRKTIKREKIIKEQDERRLNNELDRIEREARKQYARDLSRGSGSNSNLNKLPNVEFERKYFYLDRKGACYGPYTETRMALWYHFNFFPKGLRCREARETKYRRLSTVRDPFHYKGYFLVKFKGDKEFKKAVLSTINLLDKTTLPPAMDIPYDLKQLLKKISNNEKQNITETIEKSNQKQQQPKYQEIIVKKPEIEDDAPKVMIYEQDRQVDEMGFGAWESVPEKYLPKNLTIKSDNSDSDSSNNNSSNNNGLSKMEEKLMENDENLSGQKRYWRDIINENLPIERKKRRLGFDINDNDDVDNEDNIVEEEIKNNNSDTTSNNESNNPPTTIVFKKRKKRRKKKN